MNQPLRIVYEMTISHAEFFRTLPAVLGSARHVIASNVVRIGEPERDLEIRLSEETQRRFGPIPLPVTHVELRFTGYTPEAAQAFLSRFNNYFRRGGG